MKAFMNKNSRFQSVMVLNPSWALFAGRREAGHVIHFTGRNANDHYAMNADGIWNTSTGLAACQVAIFDCENAMTEAGLRNGIRI